MGTPTFADLPDIAERLGEQLGGIDVAIVAVAPGPDAFDIYTGLVEDPHSLQMMASALLSAAKTLSEESPGCPSCAERLVKLNAALDALADDIVVTRDTRTGPSPAAMH